MCGIDLRLPAVLILHSYSSRVGRALLPVLHFEDELDSFPQSELGKSAQATTSICMQSSEVKKIGVDGVANARFALRRIVTIVRTARRTDVIDAT